LQLGKAWLRARWRGERVQGTYETTRNGLLSCVVAGAATIFLGCSNSTHAEEILSSDFSVTETIQPNGNFYTVFDNSTDWYVTEFSISHSANTFLPEHLSSTIAHGWVGCDTVGNGECSGPFVGFPAFHFGIDDENTLPEELSFAIGPGSSGNWFPFVGPGDSDFTLELTDANGDTGQVSGVAIDLAATPLPAALPLFAGGLGMIGFLARRKKLKVSETV
jgi:hypothetical protein